MACYRYKKLLCTVDLTKDFFFSYSYHIMSSLQKNICDYEAGQVLYETMFVWNEFLTRGIRNHLKSTIWTVALVYGFFKQVEYSTWKEPVKYIMWWTSWVMTTIFIFDFHILVIARAVSSWEIFHGCECKNHTLSSKESSKRWL